MHEQKQTVSLVSPRKRFSREEIRERLARQTGEGRPILAVDAGIGLVSKMAEASGISLIFATAEARFRMMGLPSCCSYAALGNANDLALQALEKAARMARHTPVLAGICPGDPLREPELLLKQMRELGADGIVIGLPSGNGFGEKLDRDVVGSVLHSQADLELLQLASQMDFYTAAVCRDGAFAARAAEYGADLIIAHVGFTAGGLSGACPDSVKTPEETIGLVRDIREQAGDVPVLCHGGCLNSPEMVQRCLEETGALGFWGGSVFDRIPMEAAIGGTVSQLKALHLCSGEGSL